ncbi:MAG TPA: ABC transporter permease, partial [Kofleriaceae bacterium]|nr:ABC transporter permease [Kofleriaceae bacterium]
MGIVFAFQLIGIGLAVLAGVLIVLWKLLHFRPRHLVAFVEVLAGVAAGMAMTDRWGEVFDTIRRNKLRTTLTAVSVAWGIFVMIVLLGLGHGLNNGIRSSFRRQATNAIFMSANKTSIPNAGYGIGRRITFDNRDYDRAKKIAGIDHISGQYFLGGGRFDGGSLKVRRGAKSNSFGINAVHPDAYYIGANEIVEGRFLNDSDVTGLRKVCVIGRPVRNFLFGTPPDAGAASAGKPGATSAVVPGAVTPGADRPGAAEPERAIGQWIEVGNVAFQVVGIFSDEGGEEQERQIYIPVSTAQLAFHGQDHLGMLMLTVGDASAAQSKVIANDVLGQLATAHQFSVDDKQAVRAFNSVEASESFRMVFFAISVFVVVIGCGTLLAGVVGVSNIMMIAVKERTREIGIRKALGATPASIVAMIVQEAIFLTSIAGLFGLAAGVMALELIPRIADSEMIKSPSVDIGVGVMAAAGLVLAGAL